MDWSTWTSSIFHLNLPELIFCRSRRSLISLVRRSVSSLMTLRYLVWRWASMRPDSFHHHLGEVLDGGQWSAKLMGDNGDEVILHFVEMP